MTRFVAVLLPLAGAYFTRRETGDELAHIAQIEAAAAACSEARGQGGPHARRAARRARARDAGAYPAVRHAPLVLLTAAPEAATRRRARGRALQGRVPELYLPRPRRRRRRARHAAGRDDALGPGPARRRVPAVGAGSAGARPTPRRPTPTCGCRAAGYLAATTSRPSACRPARPPRARTASGCPGASRSRTRPAASATVFYKSKGLGAGAADGWATPACARARRPTAARPRPTRRSPRPRRGTRRPPTARPRGRRRRCARAERVDVAAREPLVAPCTTLRPSECATLRDLSGAPTRWAPRTRAAARARARARRHRRSYWST